MPADQQSTQMAIRGQPRASAQAPLQKPVEMRWQGVRNRGIFLATA